MSYANKDYFIKAIQRVYANIDKPISLDVLAKEVGLSLSSLKRLFLEATNQSAGAFIRHLRMELAFGSLQNKEMSIIEVAMRSGFEDHSAFSRRFKETFGYSPTQAREKINIVNELDCVCLEAPEILEMQDIKLQSITKRGLYFEAAPSAWQSLKDKINVAGLDDDFVGIYVGIGHDNPHEGKVKQDQVRFTAGVAFLDEDLSADTITIVGGTYARFRYMGKLNNLGLAYHYIYGKWQESAEVKINSTIPAFMILDKWPDGFQEQQLAIHVPLLKVSSAQTQQW